MKGRKLRKTLVRQKMGEEVEAQKAFKIYRLWKDISVTGNDENEIEGDKEIYESYEEFKEA